MDFFNAASRKQSFRLAHKIEGEAALDLKFNIELGIKWIWGYESLPHIGCGCEFIHISKPGLDRILEFIDSK